MKQHLYEHHQDNIRFSYRCLDRILLNRLIQPFQQPERMVGFFSTYRNHIPSAEMYSLQYNFYVHDRRVVPIQLPETDPRQLRLPDSGPYAARTLN